MGFGAPPPPPGFRPPPPGFPDGYGPGGFDEGPGHHGRGRGGPERGWDAMQSRLQMFRSMFGRGQRRGRGDVRAAILLLLADEPRNGYQIMQEIERRSDGMWRPSSGSIYPALQQLEDEGLVAVEVTEAGRSFKLTAKGIKYVAEHREQFGRPWQSDASDDPRRDVMQLVSQLHPALAQVVQYGSRQQIAEARRVVIEARSALYRILAESPDDGDDGGDDDEPAPSAGARGETSRKPDPGRKP